MLGGAVACHFVGIRVIEAQRGNARETDRACDALLRAAA